jgi:hypothetical protein
MATRMVHPLHGATHAYTPQEVLYLQGKGWTVEENKPRTLTLPPSKKKPKD